MNSKKEYLFGFACTVYMFFGSYLLNMSYFAESKHIGYYASFDENIDPLDLIYYLD